MDSRIAVGWCANKQAAGGAVVIDSLSFKRSSPILDIGGGNCSDATFSSDSKYLVTVSSKSVMRIWDAQTCRMVGQGSIPSWDWQVDSHPTLPECMTVGGHPELRRWSIPSGKLIAETITPFKRIVSAQITPDGKHLVMLGRNGDQLTVQLRSYPDFGLLQQTSISRESVRLSRLSVSPDGRLFVFAGQSGVVYSGSLKPMKLTQTPTKMIKTQDFLFIDNDHAMAHGWARPLGLFDLTSGSYAMSDVVSSGGMGVAALEQPHRLLLAHGGYQRDQGVSVWALPSTESLIADIADPGRDAVSPPPAMKTAGTKGNAENKTQPAGGEDVLNKKPALLPVPEKQEIQNAEKELQTLLGAESEDSRPLAKRLLKLTDEEDDPTIVFAMLHMAARNAMQNLDTAAAQEALDRLEQRYQINTLQLAGKLLRAIGSKPMATEAKRRMASWAEKLGDEAVSLEEIAYASAFHEIAVSWSSRDRANLRRRREKASEVDRLLPAFRQAVAFRDQFRQDPTDATACQRWGSYLCFVRGNWEDGLATLATAEDKSLREIAQADLSVTSDADAILTLAKRWRDYAKAQPQGTARSGALVAAKYWFHRAAERLRGVDKLRAKAAAEEIELDEALPARHWPTADSSETR